MSKVQQEVYFIFLNMLQSKPWNLSLMYFKLCIAKTAVYILPA